MAKETEKSTAERDKISVKEVKECWHGARNDAVGTEYSPGDRPVKDTPTYKGK